VLGSLGVGLRIGAILRVGPEPLRTALKTQVETGDLWYSAVIIGVPLEVLNEERIKARIPLVVVQWL